MRKAVCCLVAAGFVVAGCSGDGGDGKSGSDTVTVEFRATGDSPATVYIPGIRFSSSEGTGTSGDADFELDSTPTPWSKTFEVKVGRSLSLQAASLDPKKEIGCQILVNGKLKDEETKQNKPGYTLNVGCSASAVE